MKKPLKIIITLVSFALLFLMIWSSYNTQLEKKKDFKMLGETIVSFAETTADRVAKAVITLPESDIVVGLNDNIGTYKTIEKIDGRVEIRKEFLKTNFIGGIYGKRNPRLDAVVPMSISANSLGNSTYIVLFNDRGDVALEKSYARVGDRTVKVQSISTLPADENVKNEDYRVDVIYRIVDITKEVIIPVIDGHFDPKGTITK